MTKKMVEDLNFVLDTNVWVSYIISKQLDKLVEIITKNKLKVFLNNEFVNELENTLNKPKIKKYLTDEIITESVILIRKITILKINKNKVKICRDPNDDFILALCKSVKANYLVSGDKDLLVIKKFFSTIIISLSDFKVMFKR